MSLVYAAFPDYTLRPRCCCAIIIDIIIVIKLFSRRGHSDVRHGSVAVWANSKFELWQVKQYTQTKWA